MKKRNILRWVLVVFLVVAVAAIYSGGWMYYTVAVPDGPKTAWVTMTIQNLAESLLFNPVLPIEDFLEKINVADLSKFDYFRAHAYFIAMAAVPFVDFLLVFTVLDGILHILARFSIKRNRVLVVGYNDRVKQLLDVGSENSKIYLWTEGKLNDEEVRNYYMQGIVVKNNNFSFSDGPGTNEKHLRMFNKFLKRRHINSVVLVDESDTQNMQYYMALSSCPVCRYRTIHFYVLCEKNEFRLALQDIFDSKLALVKEYASRLDSEVEKLKKNRNDIKDLLSYIYLLLRKFNWMIFHKVNRTGDLHTDLRIFNFAQIQAEMLMKEQPVFGKHGEPNEEKDVHMLIIGGGYVGESIALHAMNQCVLSPNNKIYIDVLDRNIDIITGRLDDRFNCEYVVKSVDNGGVGDDNGNTVKHISYTINGEKSDGFLQINLLETDVYSVKFKDILDGCFAGNNYTYIVVALPGLDDNLHCALSIEKTVKALAESRLKEEEIFELDRIRVPVAFRMTYLESMKNYLKNHLSYCSDVFLMGNNEEYIGIDEIVDLAQEKIIRQYNMTYEMMCSSMLGYEVQSKKYAEQVWNKNKYYKRESNRALFNHCSVKAAVIAKSEASTDMADGSIFEEFDRFMSDIAGKGTEGRATDAVLSDMLVQKNEKGDDEYPLLVNFAKTEHRRFVYFYASEGWGQKQGGKDEYKRLHNCLCDWDTLCANENLKSMLIYDLISLPTLERKEDKKDK